ncbi:hypothetical protein OH77DRAFT_1248353 [Trametes cingulata]|nr:hypothetical protein OH77DRAFT_1248353 [Trametes cingulata]
MEMRVIYSLLGHNSFTAYTPTSTATTPSLKPGDLRRTYNLFSNTRLIALRRMPSPKKCASCTTGTRAHSRATQSILYVVTLLLTVLHIHRHLFCATYTRAHRDRGIPPRGGDGIGNPVDPHRRPVECTHPVIQQARWRCRRAAIQLSTGPHANCRRFCDELRARVDRARVWWRSTIGAMRRMSKSVRSKVRIVA